MTPPHPAEDPEATTKPTAQPHNHLEVARNLRLLKQQLENKSLDPKEIQEGLQVLTEVGSTALEQAIKNGLEIVSIHTHIHDDHDVLCVIRDQVGVVAAKVESSSSLANKVDQEVCDGFKAVRSEIKSLHSEVQELKSLTVSIAKSFGIVVETLPVQPS